VAQTKGEGQGYTLSHLEEHLKVRSTRLHTSKRACICVILRLAPPSSDSKSSTRISPTVETGRWPRLALGNCDIHDFEMFFILRATNAWDRWSGHVALPGGRQDVGESDLETATREVFEEVGLCLPGLREAEFSGCDTSSFECLGRLNDRPSVPGLSVATFVFLQTAVETPPIAIDASEVQACGWSKLDTLLRHTSTDVFEFNMEESLLWTTSPLTRHLGRIFSLSPMYFTRITLNIEPLYVATNSSCSGPLMSTREQPIPVEEETRVRTAFFLWGMTLGVVNDLLYHQGRVRKTPLAHLDKIPCVGGHVEHMVGSVWHNILLDTMRRAYLKSTGRPMPWAYVVRGYPLFLLSMLGASGIAVARLAPRL